jgi:tetratricopeptide (TPR) repeat protein
MILLQLALFDAFAAPATVLEHRLDVRIDANRRLTETQVWTVRIDDPAACVAGLVAPPGLDGAVDGEALILEETLIVPADAAAGTTFTLTATRRTDKGEHSGVFSTAPDLPLERAEVTIQVAGKQGLTVWADPKGDPLWSTKGGRSASVRWAGMPAGDPTRAVWSTWPDWVGAGQEVDRAVDARMADKQQLGREMASDLGATNLPELARRVFQQVKLRQGEIGSWDTSRNAGDIAKSGEGDAAERGIALIALLRAAGYDARPAWYRPISARGPFPITVAAPAMLPRPLVQARDTKGRILWIDPGSDQVAVPQMPSSLVGATVWVPGDLPTQLQNDAVVDGSVTINTQATVDGEGNVTWNASIEAAGTAQEWIRRLLGTLDQDGQTKALKRLAESARPGIERFAITSSGTSDPYKSLKITVSGHDDAVFKPFGAGMRGEVRPVLAPAMAAWLPPKIEVREYVDILGPTNLMIVANTRPGPAYDPDAQVDREARRAGPRLQLSVQAERPYASTSSGRDAAASRFLGVEAQKGVEVLLFPAPSGATVKTLAAVEGLGAAERLALEALVWWGAGNDAKANKVLKKALKTHTVAELAPMFAAWLDPADERPWVALDALLAPEAETDRLEVLLAMDAHDFERLAWLQGHQLSRSTNPNIAAEGLLVVLANQPDEKPDANVDPDGAAIWTPEADIVQAAVARATEAGGEVLQRARRISAEWALEEGVNAEQALNMLPQDTPSARALHLTQFARSYPNAEVHRRVREVVAQAPADPVVAHHAATAMASIGAHEEALAYGLGAARLAHDDPTRWIRASELALTAGRLNLALQAAQRASDLEPTSKPAALALHALAVLALDDQAEATARERGNLGKRDPAWPPSVDDLLAVAPPSGLLAVLQYHERAVLESPMLLGLRAQLRTDAGQHDEAARDSINLATLHGDSKGYALAFAASAGRVFGNGSYDLLATPDNDLALLTRMEYRLLTGSGDARVDARALRDEPPRAGCAAHGGRSGRRRPARGRLAHHPARRPRHGAHGLQVEPDLVRGHRRERVLPRRPPAHVAARVRRGGRAASAAVDALHAAKAVSGRTRPQHHVGTTRRGQPPAVCGPTQGRRHHRLGARLHSGGRAARAARRSLGRSLT